MALETAVNESQDSQAIFDAHQALFGLASVRTSTDRHTPGCAINNPRLTGRRPR